MLNIFDDVWKSQNYIKQQNDYAIQDTVYLEGQEFQWYFSSKQTIHYNKILKKSKDNCTVSKLVQLYGIQDLYEDLSNSPNFYKFDKFQQIQDVEVIAVMGRINPNDKNEIHIKQLTKKELAQLLLDFNNYPQLYKEVIIYRKLSSNEQYIDVKLSHQQFLIETNNDKQINDFKKRRLISISQNIIKGLDIVYFQRGRISEITLKFQEINNQFVLIWCSSMKNDSFNQVFKFSTTDKFLYRQELFDKYSRDQIDEELIKEKKIKEKKFQCSACLKIIMQSDSFLVTGSKIWRIRVSRGLNQIEQGKLNLKGTMIQSKNEYEFVSVCSICYDSFLQLITKIESRSIRSRQSSFTEQKTNMSLDFKAISYFPSTHDESDLQIILSQDIKIIPPEEYNSKIQKKQVQNTQVPVSLLDDFDNLLKDMNTNQSQQDEVIPKKEKTKIKEANAIKSQSQQKQPTPQNSKYNIQSTSELNFLDQNQQKMLIPKQFDSQQTVKQKIFQIRSLSAKTKKSKNYDKKTHFHNLNLIQQEFQNDYY